jgi:hypothetical protein
MYRRPKFLEVLLQIRREMALEADYDVDLFAELTRSGARAAHSIIEKLGDPANPTSGSNNAKPVRFQKTTGVIP